MNNRIPEGQRVAYIGEPTEVLSVDDRGRVVQAAGQGSHVQWTTGPAKGQITLESNLDLVGIRQEVQGSDDDIGGPLITFAVRDTYERDGTTGLLNALNRDGHLVFFESLAIEAVELIQSSIRTDASFRPILAQLSAGEAQDLIALATSILLRDAFSREA
jgi:hypothetical protein